MNITTGTRANLERARIRARDAVYDWSRPQADIRNRPFYELLRCCPPALAKAYRDALQTWAEYEGD